MRHAVKSGTEYAGEAIGGDIDARHFMNLAIDSDAFCRRRIDFSAFTCNILKS